MYEIQCFDSYGNTINNLTQWDIDQSLVIPIDKCNLPESELPSSPSYVLPEAHFSNKTREDALVVRSEKNDDNSIKVAVPNILLQDAYPLQVYVYMTDSKDTSSQKTILHNEIPVRKRQKPSDYLYVENIDRVTAEIIKDEIEEVVKETRQQAIDDINDTKDASINSVNTAKENAIDDITDTTESAIAEVDNQMNASYDEGSVTTDNGNTYTGGFVNIGNDIIAELDTIKENSSTVHNDTVSIAESTQAQIEDSINTTMNKNGLSVKAVDRLGDGNVDIVILIPQE